MDIAGSMKIYLNDGKFVKVPENRTNQFNRDEIIFRGYPEDELEFLSTEFSILLSLTSVQSANCSKCFLAKGVST